MIVTNIEAVTCGCTIKIFASVTASSGAGTPMTPLPSHSDQSVKRALRDDVKLEQDDVARIYRLVVDHEHNTKYIAARYYISRHRVQQLAKAYRENGTIPTLEIPGRKQYGRRLRRYILTLLRP